MSFSISGSSIGLKSIEGSASRAGTARSLAHLDELSDFGGVPPKSMTIKDYYLANDDGAKQITYQTGMSNYSSVILGDDRVSFNKSMTHCMYAIEDPEEVLTTSSSKKAKERSKAESERRHEYKEATKSCGGIPGVDNIENIIKLKLEQRVKFGPFQLRKNFRYFDQHCTGVVDLVDFTSALELMGFQLNGAQLKALFGRYDTECHGSIEYAKFLDKFLLNGKVMSNNSNAQSEHKLEPHIESKHEDSIDSSSDVLEMQKAELERIFRVIDRSHKGYLIASDLELLLVALGEDVIDKDIPGILSDMGLNQADNIYFDHFHNWWINRH